MPEDNQLPTDGQSDRWPISRRQFIRLSAATAGAITVSGSASALSSQKPTDLYEFVATHVDDDFAIPTLIEFSSAAGFEDVRALGHNLVTTQQPTIAAYTTLQPGEVQAVSDVETVTQLRYSPGSNPFWRLGYYPDGVFPSVENSVDFIDFEQCVDGLQHLQSRYDDRMRVSTVGESPGHYNLFLDEPGPKNLWVVEVTNDIADREAFREKQKVLFSQSIHGDERAGAEAGTRFIERLLDGRETEIEALLDDIALVFLYPNPDGWVSRDPRYRIDSNGDGKPEPNTFKRTTATGVDPNRQYPTVGWINAGYHPAEPNGSDLQDDAPGIDDDVPAEYVEKVPDALDIVEYLRGYENLSIGSDLHGMFTSPDFIEGLIVNDQYDTGEYHSLYEWNRRTENRLEATLGGRLNAAQDQFATLNEEYGKNAGFDGSSLPVPQEAYNYGTILDTIGYTTTGTLISWMSQPKAQGGLGIQMMAHEIGWDNRVTGRIEFRPWLVGLQVDGYTEVIRATAKHTVRDVSATIRTDNSTAYVETDALTRSSDALSFEDATCQTETTSTTVGAKQEEVTIEVPSTTRSLSLTVTPTAGTLLAKLRTPDGRVVRTFNPAGDEESDLNSQEGIAEWMVDSPTSGEWTVDLKSRGGRAMATVTSAVLVGTSGTVDAPDPESVLGYSQRPYSVTPLEYFPDYAEYVDERGRNERGRGRNGKKNKKPNEKPNGNGNITETMVGLSVEDIASGALFRGASDRLAVENLVLIHADGKDTPEYVAALDSFVAAGGNLVLTDRGVRLLCAMSNDRVADITPDDVTEIEVFSAYLAERIEDHPLLADTRPIQSELWKPAPLGYPISTPGTAPLTVIKKEAFSAADGSIAGYSLDNPFGPPETRKRYVAAGSFTNGDRDDTGIHVIGGLLPPAKQSSLHPFGMLEYTATFLGHTMLTNALGYQQVRYVNGERVGTFGTLK
jgi:hypothetical protein